MIKNLTTLFEKWGSEVNPKIAVSDEESSLSYDELFNSVALISNIIKNYNFKQNDIALILLPNSVKFIQAHLSIIYSSGISVPCDILISPFQLNEIIKNCNPSFVFTNKIYFQKFGECIANANFKHIFIFAKNQILPRGVSAI